jgi:hypothetical protein
MFISAKSAKEEEKKCCCLLVFQSLLPIKPGCHLSKSARK